MPHKKEQKDNIMTTAQKFSDFFQSFHPDIGNFNQLVQQVNTMENSAKKVKEGSFGWKQYYYEDGSYIWYNRLSGEVNLEREKIRVKG